MHDVQEVRILAINEAEAKHLDDTVVVEEPLEIRVNNVTLGVTMRTPGDDVDLATGLLWTEGIIRSADEIGTIAHCPNEDDPQLKNIIHVTLADSARQIRQSRNTWASSSCGICGKSAIEAVRQEITAVTSPLRVDRRILIAMPQRMRARQMNFARTGGIHAAGLFDTAGNLLAIREDLGRHNAVDKLLGAALRAGVNTRNALLMVSGRLGFEIAQKAVVAGIPVTASVSAPSSLAIALAHDAGMTAIGFVRGASMNVYTHPQRVIYGLSKYSS